MNTSSRPPLYIGPSETGNPQTIRLVLPLPPEILHPNGRTRVRGYRASMVRKARGEAAMVARAQRPASPWRQAVVQPVFYLARRRDGDGLNAWLKPYLDGLQDAGIVANDSGITLLPPEQVTGKKAGRSVELVIRQLEPTNGI